MNSWGSLGLINIFLFFQVISISNVFAQTFSLTSSSTSITLSWTGAATPVYTDFTITVDGTVAYDGTGMGERLQMDGSEELTGLVPGNQYIIAVTGDGSVIYSNIQRTGGSAVWRNTAMCWSADVRHRRLLCQWLSERLWYLECVKKGDTAVLC